MTPELLLDRPQEIDPEVAKEIDGAAATPFQTLPYARALDAIKGDVRVARVVEGSRVLGHAIVRYEEPLGYARWDGVGVPAVRSDPAAFWEALVAAARARRIVSLAWREPTVTRYTVEHAIAVKGACERTGARVVIGELHGHLLPLAQGAEAAWQGFDRRHRNAVRHAERDGVRVERGAPDFAEAFATLAAATWARSGRTSLPRAYFERLVEEGRGWISTYLARDAAGGPVAGAIVAREGQGALYLHGASVPAAPGASTLLQWTIVRELAHARVARYDLGAGQPPGSPGDDVHEQGIRRFKERFGGEAQRRPTVHVTPDVALYAEARDAVTRSISRS